MPLSAGDKAGPSEILALTGKGGTGEVCRAHDPRNPGLNVKRFIRRQSLSGITRSTIQVASGMVARNHILPSS